VQIGVLNGVYTDAAADFRMAYPLNYVPVAVQQGISNGYLRPADGIELFGTGPGIDRGGTNWNGVYYRVMGTKFVRINADGSHVVIGDVGAGGQVSFDNSFDRLAIASGGSLYYYNGTALTSVTDPDLGTVIDVIWVDGYFMGTDGTTIVVTELNDPTAVNPLKYGSAEADPDGIKALLKLKNEPVVVGRYTIEFFDNVGGDLFPFARIEGAQIQSGALGTHCAVVFMEAVAYLGSGFNEAPAVWLGANSQAAKLSTREIDRILLTYSEEDLSKSIMEARVDKGHQHLLLHLPDRCLVYDGIASAALREPVWFVLSSAASGVSQYRAKNLVWCYDAWLCGDPTSAAHGKLTDLVSSHYGQAVGWEFGTAINYNEGRSAVMHELELVALSGRVALDKNPTLATSYSHDGETWSQEHWRSAGRQGERNKRLNWLQQGLLNHWRIQKFRGNSDAHLTVARLEARIEALNV
jgi:hypothetical protein